MVICYTVWLFFFPSGIVAAVLCFLAAVTVVVAVLCCYSELTFMTLALNWHIKMYI